MYYHREKNAELSRHKQPCIGVCVEVDVTGEHVGSRELMWKSEDEIEERERERERFCLLLLVLAFVLRTCLS